MPNLQPVATPLVALLLCGFWVCAETLTAAETGYQGDVTDVVTIDRLPKNGPYNKIWQPHIARWTDKHLVACYGLQLNGKLDMGDIVCSISKDNGKTWSPRIMVFDHRARNGSVQYAYNNSVLFRPQGSDVIWLFVMRAPLHYRNSENADLVAAYTADGGYSWHHVELAMDYQNALIIVGGIKAVEVNGQTRYLLPAHRNSRRHDKTGDRRQFVLESTSLLHWKLAGYVPYPDDDPVFLHEGTLAPTPDGAWKMLLRTATMDTEKAIDPPLAYSSVSRDGGRTWSTARPEPDLPNHRAKSYFGLDSNGKYVYVYSDHYDRFGLYYKTSPDGENWSAEKAFYYKNNHNSYPTLIEDRPGEWIAVWDSSDSPEFKRRAIRFGRLNVSK
ncbi:MAG: sialidase family protein [Planctomycetota bacterium]|jgi:hypothetical protein